MQKAGWVAGSDNSPWVAKGQPKCRLGEGAGLQSLSMVLNLEKQDWPSTPHPHPQEKEEMAKGEGRRDGGDKWRLLETWPGRRKVCFDTICK